MCTKEDTWLALKIFGLAALVFLFFQFGLVPLRDYVHDTPSMPPSPAPSTPSKSPFWGDEKEEYDVYLPRPAKSPALWRGSFYLT